MLDLTAVGTTALRRIPGGSGSGSRRYRPRRVRRIGTDSRGGSVEGHRPSRARRHQSPAGVGAQLVLKADHQSWVGLRFTACLKPVDLSPSGPPDNVLPVLDETIRARLSAAGDQTSYAAIIADNPACLEAWAGLAEHQEISAATNADHVEVYGLLPDWISPRPRRTAQERLARVRVRSLGRGLQSRLSAMPRRPPSDGRTHRRRGRATPLCGIPPPASTPDWPPEDR